MNKQRGIIAAIYLYGFAALAALGVIYGVYSWIDYTWETSAGIKRGEANKQAAWNDANRKARAAEESARAERDRLAGEQSARLAVAEGRARDADANWRRARSAAARASVPLVVADCTGPAGGVSAPAPGGGGLRLATSMRFSHQFVREWDDAWTDAAGKPVFGDPGRPLEAPGAASAIDAEAVLANHGENASRCSANSRQMNMLVDLIERLRARP